MDRWAGARLGLRDERSEDLPLGIGEVGAVAAARRRQSTLLVEKRDGEAPQPNAFSAALEAVVPWVAIGSAFALVEIALGCQAVGVRTYGQYCPIARASELLAERWSFIILRNIVLIGCRTFNEIADGAPGLSRGLLSKRLRDLERAGVIEIRPKPDGPGSTYEPTQAGRELSEVMLAMQRWGAQWAELTPEHAHPGVVLWGWVTCHLDRGRLPRRRVLVRFDYPTLSGPGSRGWLLIERGDAEICEKHPGGEEDLVVVVSDPVTFARWDLGELEWGDAVRGGAIEVQGSRALARALPTWKRTVLSPVTNPSPPDRQLDNAAERGSPS
jgi:DNA-binding HxlR family transcriptional regulator